MRSILTSKDHHILLGQHLNQYKSGDPEEPYMTWMRRWPSQPLIRYYEFLHGDAVLINNPKAYQEVMNNYCYSFVRSVPFRRLIGDIIGEGLVFAEGDTHRAQRRALGGLFTKTNIRTYVPSFNRKALKLVQDVDTAARGPGKVESKSPTLLPEL